MTTDDSSTIPGYQELADDMQRSLDEIDEIRARYGTDESVYPAGQKTRHDNLSRRATKLMHDMEALTERAAKVEQVRAAVESGTGLERGFHTYSADPTARRRSDPWRGLGDMITRADSPTGLRTRALDAIEMVPDVPAAGRAFVTQVVESCPDNSAAEFVLATGNPHYRTAFEKVLQNPTHGFLEWDRDEQLAYQQTGAVRTAMSLTSGNGGYMVPLTLDPTIILTNTGAINPWRELATVQTTTTNTWQGVTSTGVNAEWKVEGAQAADASPTVASVSIPTYLADAYVFGSYEILGDSNFATQLPTLLADAKNRIEENAYAIGSGSGAPTGAITAVSAITASRVASATTGSIQYVDLYNLYGALPDRYYPNASVVVNKGTGLTIRQFDTYGGAQFWANLNETSPTQLIGKNYREATSVASSIVSGNYCAIFGDFRQGYTVVDRLGLQLQYIPAVVGANFRPTGQAGWLGWWRTGAQVTNTDAFRVLKVK